MFFLAGAQSILLGLLAEMVMRTYYESQSKTTYLIDEVRQGDSDMNSPLDGKWERRLLQRLRDCRTCPRRSDNDDARTSDGSVDARVAGGVGK